MTELKLKYREKLVLQVDYNDLNEFITQAYGLTQPYEVVAEEEWGNDQSHTLLVEKRELDEDELEDIVTMEATKGKRIPSYTTSTLLDDLCNKGLIEPGEYLVRVTW